MMNLFELERFESICEVLADPAFYPHDVTRVERRDTHISAVFLTGEWVYKLKKPVDFGFLNFSDLDDRRRFCENEVHLNRRFSRDVYQGVVEIFETEDGRFTFEQTATVAEYAVKMKQLPDDASLSALLEAGKITEAHMRQLGRNLAVFYGDSDRNADIDRYGGFDIIAYNVEENFSQLKSFEDTFPDKDKWALICRASRDFLDQRRSLFEDRVRSGHIRDGHGDLRAEHVYFENGLQILDCIEFNERFRYGDVAVDLAFLHMDLERLGYSAFSRQFLAAYVEAAEDPQLYALLDFYAAYRAVVRLKVACLQCQDAKDSDVLRLQKEAAVYFNLAYRYTLQFNRPTLWVFCGLPAAGKSCLAEKLAQTLSVPVFQSDTIRKEALGDFKSRVVPFGEGTYRQEMRDEVYRQLNERARENLDEGVSVILDATFSCRRWREDVRQVAASADANLIFVESRCDVDTLRSRLTRREATAGVSDARLAHLPDMLKKFEPLSELEPEIRLTVNTDQSLEASFIQLLAAGYRSQCLQVEKIIDQ